MPTTHHLRGASEHKADEAVAGNVVTVEGEGAGGGERVVGAHNTEAVLLALLDGELDGLVEHDHTDSLLAVDAGGQGGVLDDLVRLFLGGGVRLRTCGYSVFVWESGCSMVSKLRARKGPLARSGVALFCHAYASGKG